MKKTILGLGSIVLVLIIMITSVLAVDVELNLKVRRKVNTLLRPYEIVTPEPMMVYLSNEGLVIEPNSKKIIQEKDDTGHTFLNIKQLNLAGTTAHFDENNKVLSIVGDRQHLMIYGDGKVEENNEPIEATVTIKMIESEWYIDITELNTFESGQNLGFYEQMYQAGSNLVVLNAYETYSSISLNHKTWVFQSIEKINEYRTNQFELAFLYKLKNVFFKTEISSVVNNTRAFVYAIDEGALLIVGENNEVGYIELPKDSELKSVTKSKRQIPSDGGKGYNEPIVMTWEAVYSYNPDTTTIPEMKSLNVISPTWYELSDATGNITSKASKDYTAWAKSRGYEVWALASNAFDIDRTHEFLSNAPARMKFIEFMISEAKEFGYEGINIDFENVYLADRDALTHFVHEFATYCKKNRITLSMDVTVMGGSDNWSKCYDHQALGEFVDFLIIMTYDEHWASSPISGPVASYDWMLRHMTELVTVVPSEKLIMGVPFYTRVWREYPSNETANLYSTDSSAIGMEAQNTLIEKYELKLIWDDTDKLYYATFFEEDAQVKIWIENAETLSAKLDIINTLGLKGVAAWRRGFETEDIWSIFEKLNR